jgi:hypothetical protein
MNDTEYPDFCSDDPENDPIIADAQFPVTMERFS